MAISREFVDYLLDQLDTDAEIVAKRMFGGHGLYADGYFFAIVNDGRLYLKTDEQTRAAYEALEMGPFRPPSGQVLRRYYELPEHLIDDRIALRDWAQAAIRVAIACGR